ncbi:coniferyl aldehyde dehydrogenase [Neisseria shayeganii]|uniref:Aldehyde dehydrogenase n=1 Tax=Neisseria shayeganii TaxID=607712 RepID=A0A7D7NCY0_9NEIS|nr:coniferyl aldehyde dehydrogenase [Neisseria shayeganii]QMT41416.1 coniferyl aldehyde dehydrogenase [Neisseria shayeganii]
MPPENLSALFDRLRRAADAQTEVPWLLRQDRLQRLAKMLREQRLAIAEAIDADFSGRSRHETDLLELFPSLAGIRHALKHGKKWMRPRKVATEWYFWPGKSRILPQPLGLVGIVSPWNYPLYLVAGPLTGAFAAGNRAMVKVSEFTPAFARWLADAAPRYFAEDELAVVCGGADTAAAFTALPFDHLLFTGSTEIGKKVMRAAAEHLTPLTLELGGKSPTLLLEDADIRAAAARVMSGKLVNAGQTCIAPDYVLLPEAAKTDFVAAAKQWVAAHYPQLADNPDYSRIINPDQHRRLTGYLKQAQQSRAQVMALGASAEGESGTTLLPPYLVWDAPEDCRLMQEEIFGPLLPLVGYQSLDDALAYIRARPRPLALYVFGRNPKEIERVLRQSVAGGVTVNDTLLHIAQDNLPFGGVGPSGMGAYHGQAGFDTFSHLKPVFYQARFNSMGLLAPPYGRVFRLLLKVLLR